MNNITYGGSNTNEEDTNLNEDASERYDEILPIKMKSYQPEINDTGSFAMGVMPPLDGVRVSIGSQSMSKQTTQQQVMTPNETGKSGQDSYAYAPSINTKSIMKQSVFSPLENKRLDQSKDSRDTKKVQIMEANDKRFRAQRDSILDQKKRDAESPMVNMGSRVESRLRTSPMGHGTGDLNVSHLTSE